MDPVAGFRFGVFFFVGGVIPNPLDIRFKDVSGLNATVNVVQHREGGQQLYTHRLPDGITYENLVLTRGVIVGSPLTIEFNLAMSAFKFAPSNVLVTLLAESKVPLAAWMFIRAYPVRWATATLSADDKSVLIETMELAYSRMQVVRV